MTDHGELDDFEVAQVIGEKLMEMRQTLDFTGPGAIASSDLRINDVAYRMTITRVTG